MERWRERHRDSERDLWRCKDLDTQQPDTVTFPCTFARAWLQLVPRSPCGPLLNTLLPHQYPSKPPPQDLLPSLERGP